MKKLILTTTLLILSTSSFASIMNVGTVCITNHTDNHGKSTFTHWVEVQLSQPGKAGTFGPQKDYGQTSCVDTALLPTNKVFHIYSVGYKFVNQLSYTDCGAAFERKQGQYWSTKRINFVASQYTSPNGDTQCKLS